MDDKIVSLVSLPGKDTHHSGFTTAQFKKIDGLFLQAASVKALNYRTVDCDFETGRATYTYFKSEGQSPAFSFVIQRVGPRTLMYEVYKQGKGKIAKSGMFDIAFERLQAEIQKFIETSA
ncbi:MAG: hypothetical protein LRZ85_09490 [Alphaproteobacteria bacterium]|nr:hypothetical protein [Alphaproteobacteria bacterium]MCD8520510.1 hypothetical protein [Alphaproteobacteria bacterium]MCD8570647.1 hypothetical protein [Alphaproteobacteria bacterium]